MEALAAIAALVGAGVVQVLNRYKANNTVLLKFALVVVGLLAYAVGNGFPPAWTGPKFLEWLSPAWLWALAVPGAASMAGTIPGMQTNSK